MSSNGARRSNDNFQQPRRPDDSDVELEPYPHLMGIIDDDQNQAGSSVAYDITISQGTQQNRVRTFSDGPVSVNIQTGGASGGTRVSVDENINGPPVEVPVSRYQQPPSRTRVSSATPNDLLNFADSPSRPAGCVSPKSNHRQHSGRGIDPHASRSGTSSHPTSYTASNIRPRPSSSSPGSSSKRHKRSRDASTCSPVEQQRGAQPPANRMNFTTFHPPPPQMYSPIAIHPPIERLFQPTPPFAASSPIPVININIGERALGNIYQEGTYGSSPQSGVHSRFHTSPQNVTIEQDPEGTQMSPQWESYSNPMQRTGPGAYSKPQMSNIQQHAGAYSKPQMLNIQQQMGACANPMQPNMQESRRYGSPQHPNFEQRSGTCASPPQPSMQHTGYYANIQQQNVQPVQDNYFYSVQPNVQQDCGYEIPQQPYQQHREEAYGRHQHPNLPQVDVPPQQNLELYDEVDFEYSPPSPKFNLGQPISRGLPIDEYGGVDLDYSPSSPRLNIGQPISRALPTSHYFREASVTNANRPRGMREPSANISPQQQHPRQPRDQGTRRGNVNVIEPNLQGAASRPVLRSPQRSPRRSRPNSVNRTRREEEMGAPADLMRENQFDWIASKHSYITSTLLLFGNLNFFHDNFIPFETEFTLFFDLMYHTERVRYRSIRTFIPNHMQMSLANFVNPKYAQVSKEHDVVELFLNLLEKLGNWERMMFQIIPVWMQMNVTQHWQCRSRDCRQPVTQNTKTFVMHLVTDEAPHRCGIRRCLETTQTESYVKAFCKSCQAETPHIYSGSLHSAAQFVLFSFDLRGTIVPVLHLEPLIMLHNRQYTLKLVVLRHIGYASKSGEEDLYSVLIFRGEEEASFMHFWNGAFREISQEDGDELIGKFANLVLYEKVHNYPDDMMPRIIY